MRLLARRMHLLIMTAALLVSGDDIASTFIKDATAIKLDKYLEQFIGECAKGDDEDKKACKDNAEQFRKSAADKNFVVELPSAFARSLRPIESKDASVYLYHFTPFFDGNGYALTFGKPIGQAGDGSPKIKPSTLQIPANEDGQTVLDGFKVDRVSVQLVFKGGEVWKLKTKKGEVIYGVGVKPVMLHLQEARSGASATTVF